LIQTATGELLTGFENHAGRTTRAVGVMPLGTVRSGIGNGDGTDGARAGQIFGTYLHGPALARNSSFADELISIATGMTLTRLDDHEEGLLCAERLREFRAREAASKGFLRRLRPGGDRGLVSS
jgi:CobQ-like glutamine amidotransferase family enzyme